MDLSTLSLAEMKSLLTQLPHEIQRREKQERHTILRELELLAQEKGFSLDDLLGTPIKKTKVISVKFRHPDNPELAWSGRGRQPRWVTEYLAHNGSLESLQV